jgi:hypothetical protein
MAFRGKKCGDIVNGEVVTKVFVFTLLFDSVFFDNLSKKMLGLIWVIVVFQ